MRWLAGPAIAAIIAGTASRVPAAGNAGRRGAPVELVTARGRHAWPGGRRWAFGGPEPMQEISATEAM
jgi:hypothetical protein